MLASKIGIYLVSFSGGGAEREMIYLANDFAARGYQVDLIVHRDKGPLGSLVSDNVNLIVIDRTYLHDFVYLVKYMRSSKPEFILSTLHLPNWVLSLAKFVSFSNTKISWRIVISLSDSMSNNGKFLGRCLKVFYPFLSKMVDKVVCVSQGVADDVIKNFGLPEEKVSVMYNPAYSPNIHVLSEQSIQHAWFSNKYKTVVSLGRLSHQKDYHTLIRAFSKVVEECADARLVVFGEGELREELQREINSLRLNDYIELYGFEINPYKYLAKSDLFVLSSIYEGFGNVIVEALALNVPVISTDCPSGPAEILESGKWGDLVPVGSSKDLSMAILNALKSSRSAITLNRAKEFSVESVVDGYEKLMR